MTLPDNLILDLSFLSSIPIPQLIHPSIVHFAIALPIIIIIVELFNLFANKSSIGLLNFLLMIIFSFILLVTYLTGTTDAELAKNTIEGSQEISSLFKRHKIDGIYIFYGSFILLFIKILSVIARKIAVRVLFLLLLIVFSAILFNVAYKGTKLVYKYGLNVSIENYDSSEKVEKSGKSGGSRDLNSTEQNESKSK